MSAYIEDFQSAEDVIKAYGAPANALDGANVLLAWYGMDGYEGKSLVLFEKDGKLWEVNGGHCSCYGLEGQWEPEETAPEALLKRDFSWCSGGKEATAELHKIANRLLGSAGGSR